MKEKDAYVDYENHQMVMYVEKDDGTYGMMKTGSYMAKNYFDDFLEKQRTWDSQNFNRLVKGEYSPVAYYMAVLQMTPADVASRMRLRTATVRKHMDPRRFGAMTVELARRYAELFGVALADLFHVPEPGHARQAFEKTHNPYVIIMRGGKGEK